MKRWIDRVIEIVLDRKCIDIYNGCEKIPFLLGKVQSASKTAIEALLKYVQIFSHEVITTMNRNQQL